MVARSFVHALFCADSQKSLTNKRNPLKLEMAVADSVRYVALSVAHAGELDRELRSKVKCASRSTKRSNNSSQIEAKCTAFEPVKLLACRSEAKKQLKLLEANEGLRNISSVVS